MPLANAAAAVGEAWHAGLMPDPDITVDEWAEQYRYLPPDSAEPGKFRLSRTPFMRDILRDLSPGSEIEEVVLVKGGQVSGSESANNFIGHIMHVAPGRTMMVQPTVDAAKDYTRERIDTLIDYTPVLKQRVAEAKSRDGANTVKFKRFAGGFLAVTGANSAQGLQSRAVRFLILDEIDRYPRDVDGQGDPVGMALKRTDTFKRNRKVFKLSTPGNKDESRIMVDYDETDQRRYFVPCPHCGHADYLRWERIKWPKGRPEDAYAVCEECGAAIDEHHKTAMLAAGEWRPTATSKRPRSRGYHVPGLLSPIGWRSWGDIATDWEQARGLAARGDDTLLKKVTNLDLGEAYEQQGERATVSALKARTEPYEKRMVPYGGLIVVSGVDVQHNRLECHAIAIGRHEEAWVVDYEVLWGDTLQAQVWKDLDAWLLTPLRYQNGAEMRIAACAIDAGDGHTADEVFKFCRSRGHRHVFAIKGAKPFDAPVLPSPTAREVDRGGKRVKNGDLLWVIGVSAIKCTLAARLRLDTPGRNFIHFGAWLEDDYFEQLGSEKLVKKFQNGNVYRRWVPTPGVRNEAWDTMVYAHAAAVRIGLNRWPEYRWDECEQRLMQVGLFPAPAEDASPGSSEAIAEAEAPPPPQTQPAPSPADPATPPSAPPLSPPSAPRGTTPDSRRPPPRALLVRRAARSSYLDR